jgi:HAD superfamily hydrolase (TIGR01549 family)
MRLEKTESLKVRMIREIIFDFDGTIADTFEISVKILNQFKDEYNFEEITPKKIKKLKGESFAKIIKGTGISIFKTLTIARRVQKELNNQMDKVEIFKGMIKLFEKINKTGIKMGIMTSNSKKNVNKFLKENDINYFDYIYSGINLFGKNKLMKKILRERELREDEVIYVGDEIRDVEACKKVGIKMVAVVWGFNSKEGLKKAKPNWLVDGPEEIFSVLIKK